MSTDLTPRATAVRSALIEATSRLLFERGADVTLDDIAATARVGRRTIFRYFGGKDDLVAEALAAYFRSLADEVPTRDGRDVKTWLRDVAATIHAQNLRISAGYLELASRRRDIASISDFLDRPGRVRRRDRMAALAQEAWSASDRPGSPPAIVIDAFLLHLSVHGTEALRLHARLDADAMADLTAMSLVAIISATDH